MTKRLLVAAAVLGGLLMTPIAPQPAAAMPPLAKIDAAKADGITLAKRGGRRGGFRSRGGRRSFGRGGGRRSFGRGGGRKSFRGGGRRNYGGIRRGGRKSFRRGRSKRGYGRRSSYYLPYVPYYYGRSYYDYGYVDCERLRQKALDTDRSYWWRRYDRCINDY